MFHQRGCLAQLGLYFGFGKGHRPLFDFNLFNADVQIRNYVSYLVANVRAAAVLRRILVFLIRAIMVAFSFNAHSIFGEVDRQTN
jgi:hypothetical protein